jgi:hypothetical protein
VFSIAVLFTQAQGIAANAQDIKQTRILFVGNSLTYVGNIPAVFKELSRVSGRDVEVDMLAQPGATLTERWQDGSVSQAMHNGSYSVVVLQERGADLMCDIGDNSCDESKTSLAHLTKLAQANHAKIYVLGTYQTLPAASRSVVANESAAAQLNGAEYVEISETFARLRAKLPELAWFSQDGSLHPGADLALLDAILLFRAIYGVLPLPIDVQVKAPIYTVKAGPSLELDAARRASGTAKLQADQNYSKDTIDRILRQFQ